MTYRVPQQLGMIRSPGRVAALVGVLLAGCGATSPTHELLRQRPRPPASLFARTSNGLSYSLALNGSGARQCATATYRSPLANGLPIVDMSHSCGQPAGPGHPVLVQAHTSAQSLLTDVTTGACGRVTAGRTPARLRPVAVRCTKGVPAYRVTILPKARRLVIRGVPGVPVINFPRHVCKTGICITPLPPPVTK